MKIKKHIFNDPYRELMQALNIMKSCNEVAQKNAMKLKSQCKKLNEALDKLAKIDEKENPRYPYMEGDGYANGLPVYDYWQCPRCGAWYEVETEKYNYCPDCGQHINWNEYKEDGVEE